MNESKKIISDFARQLGFSEIGFARAETLDDELKKYDKWLGIGCQASMSYLERNREKRYDINNILPGAQTVIVAAYNYYTPYNNNSNEDTTVGKVSRYAWGDDYHDVILLKLKQIAIRITELIPCTESKCYIDTGPILEKAWAVRAGLGWQAKNTTIISKKLGSWFFIGIILTTAKIESDNNRIKDHCGKCTLCIEACPTGAIVAPRILDSNECISYWTIETKPDVEFPVSIRKNLDGWLFGCDICQDVCPWNKKLQIESTEEKFNPRNNETSLSLDNLLNMNKDEYRIRFNNSPLKRVKLEGLKRNARELLGSNE